MSLTRDTGHRWRSTEAFPWEKTNASTSSRAPKYSTIVVSEGSWPWTDSMVAVVTCGTDASSVCASDPWRRVLGDRGVVGMLELQRYQFFIGAVSSLEKCDTQIVLVQARLVQFEVAGRVGVESFGILPVFSFFRDVAAQQVEGKQQERNVRF